MFNAESIVDELIAECEKEIQDTDEETKSALEEAFRNLVEEKALADAHISSQEVRVKVSNSKIKIVDLAGRKQIIQLHLSALQSLKARMHTVGGADIENHFQAIGVNLRNLSEQGTPK